MSGKKILDGGIIAVVAGALLFGSYESIVSASPPETTTTDQARLSCLDRLNAWRLSRGLPAFERDKALEEEAAKTANECVRRGFLAHRPVDGATRWEIIAYNSGGFSTALEQWELSNKGHRAALFSNCRKAGCVCVRAKGGVYCCVRFK